MKFIKKIFGSLQASSKKLLKNENFWPLVFVLAAGILASRTLIFQGGYFNMHDDLQMMRQLEMEKCFLDFQIPCRWVPDMGYGYGFPLFNFYPPLPYLIGQVIRIFGFAFTQTVKITFSLAIISSGVAMFFLAKEYFGKVGGILSSIFYIWAPYHAVDVYVRGAMNEAWALTWFPLILLAGCKLISEKKNIKKLIIALSLSLFALFATHNLMVMIFTPVLAVWCILWLVRTKNWKIIPKLVISGIWGLSLAAFFTLPAVFENGLTWLESQLVGYYDYTAHFVSLNQLLFSRFWGYGPSVWVDAEDGMSFQIGHIHWILSLLILAILVYRHFIRKQKLNNASLIVFLMLGVGWFSAFMTHVRSTPIYQTFSFLSLVQFPWRFLTLIIFSFSFAIGVIPALFKKERIGIYVASGLSIFVIAFNWIYFLPQGGKMGKLTDEEKFSGVAWDLQLTAGIYDYLPKTAKEAPKAPKKTVFEIMKGKTEVSGITERTGSVSFDINAEEDSVVRLNILMFPGWKVWIDGKKTEVSIPDEEKWGRMWIGVPSGVHKIEARFTDTPIRTFSNTLSILAWGYLLLQLSLWRKKNI